MTPWQIRSRARRSLVGVLSFVADMLREETTLDVEVASAPAPSRAAPRPAKKPVIQAPAAKPERHGAAALADAAGPKSPEPVDLDLLMSGTSAMSGDLSAIVDERRSASQERATGGGGDPKEDVIEALHTIFDPEIPIDIYELGLIYNVDVADDNSVDVRMTLTSPNCPAAQSLPAEVELKVGAIDWVTQASVEVVFEPTWGPELMSEEARLELNI